MRLIGVILDGYTRRPKKRARVYSDKKIMDRFNLKRFTEAQNEGVYESALKELRKGKKLGHWMWFIFPQIKGLGHSSKSEYYGINNLEEAVAYLSDPVLGSRMIQCVETLLRHTNCSAEEIFSYPDYLKFRSSLTLFEKADKDLGVFTEALEKYFQGHRDEKTLELVQNEET